MEQELNRKTMVIGHRNPDTDSICSAICYANLKQAVTGEEYMPARAGHLNGETQFVLDYFGAQDQRCGRQYFIKESMEYHAGE